MEPELRFILLGKTGNGKSATGNFILKKNHFESRQGANSVTKKNESATAILDFANRKITVVDTPGVFDNESSMLETVMKIQKSLDLARPGPNAFLLVIKPGRFTREEEQTLGFLRMTFGIELLNYAIVIFTHEDQIDGDITDIIDGNRSLKDLFHECGKRYITLNTRENNSAVINGKLEQLLQLAKKVSDNGKKMYVKNINIYRNVLESHVKEWNQACLTGEQIKQILREQEEERLQHLVRTGVKVVAGAGAVVAAGAVMYSAGPVAVRAIGGAVAKRFTRIP